MTVLKTKDILCHKDLGGEGEMITCSYKGKTTEIYMHPSVIRISNTSCRSTNGFQDCTIKSPKTFKIGQGWSDDFDYCGMVKAGINAKVSDDVKMLEKLFNSFEDVNYHSEAELLYDAIQLIEKKKFELAEKKMKEFNKINKKNWDELC